MYLRGSGFQPDLQHVVLPLVELIGIWLSGYAKAFIPPYEAHCIRKHFLGFTPLLGCERPPLARNLMEIGMDDFMC